MSTNNHNNPAKGFLDAITHLVRVAEQYARPQTPDEFYTALQAREDSTALIDYTMERLMFLGQQLGKLPPLPDITTLGHQEEEQEAGQDA